MLQWIKQSKDNWNKDKRHINSKIIKLLRFLWFFDFLTFWFYVLPQWKTDQDNRMLGNMFMILFPVVGIVLKRAKTTEIKRKKQQNNQTILIFWFFLISRKMNYNHLHISCEKTNNIFFTQYHFGTQHFFTQIFFCFHIEAF